MIQEEHRALESSRLKFVCHTCHLITVRLNMLGFLALSLSHFLLRCLRKLFHLCKTVNVELHVK